MEKLSNIIEILAYVQYYVHLRYGIVMKSPNMDKLNFVNEHPILTWVTFFSSPFALTFRLH